MSSTIERKLAAIMFTDIAGYTSQMSKDQDVALSMLDTKRKALKPLIQKYNGTLIKEMGDGTLSHFSYPIDATKCSTELQKSLKNNQKSSKNHQRIIKNHQRIIKNHQKTINESSKIIKNNQKSTSLQNSVKHNQKSILFMKIN